MSKKRRRKKMKPYQVKLRVIGVLSLVISMLVLWLPVPARAVNGAEKTNWQEKFSYERDTVSGVNYLDLKTYNGLETDPPGSRPEDSALTAAGMLTVPDGAVLGPTSGTGSNELYKPRIGKAGAAVFKGKNWLTRIDLSNVRIDDTATSLKELFSGCTALREVVFPADINTETVTDISGMFQDCGALTKLDLSKMDLSGFTAGNLNDKGKYKDVFANCSNLEVIESPKNLAPGYKDEYGIKLPGKYRYSYQDSNGTVSSETLDYLPTIGNVGMAPDKSVTLYRANDLEKLEIQKESDNSTVVENDGTSSGIPSAAVDDIEVNGYSGTYRAVLTPVSAENKTIAVAVLKGSDCVSVEPASVTVGPDGTAIFKIKGNKKTQTEPARIQITASSTSTLHEETRNVILEVNVIDQVIKLTKISIPDDFTYDAKNGDYSFTATKEPADATEKVNWSVDDTSIATIDPDNGVMKPKKTGTVTVTAASSDGSVKDTCKVTITSSYTLAPDDQRNDAINHISYAKIPDVQYNPVKGDRLLHIEQSDGSILGSKIPNVSEDYKTFFKMQVKDGTNTVSTPADEDYGYVTIQIALPGKMWGKPGLYPCVYEAGSSGASPIDTQRVTLNSYVEGVEFKIPIGSLAQEYAIVLEDQRTGYKLTPDDMRTDPTQKATVSRTDKTTQNRDLILHVKEVTATAASDAPKLYKYVEDHYKDHTAKHFYLIYLTDVIGNPVKDFTEVDVRLTLPSDVSYNSPDFVFLTEKANGQAAVEPDWTKDTIGSTECARYQPTHFSEAVVLDKAAASATTYTITARADGGSTRGTTGISGSGIAVTTTAGGDPTTTVPDGTRVTVRATAAKGYRFSYWTEGTSTAHVQNEAGTGDAGEEYTFTAGADRELVAHFAEDTVTPAPGPDPTPGATYTVTIDPLPSTAGTATADKASYGEGETATLTATANDGFVFMYWADPNTKEPVSSASTITMTMDGNKHLLAVFAQGEVAGAERSVEATVNVSIPTVEATVTVPDINANVNANVNLSIPDINVNLNYPGATSVAGTSSSFIPVRIGNSIDMPRTGIGDIYRMIVAMLLVLSGAVEILLSIPAKKRAPVRRRAI